MFSMEITGRIHSSRLTPLKSIMVSGTKIIRDTSLVTNMELKKTPNIRKSESPAMDLKFALSFIRGLNSFSCLKPSKTVSIINRMPSVLQSMEESSAFDGGVNSSDTAAATTATGSIGSFFKNIISFFIFFRSSFASC